MTFFKTAALPGSIARQHCPAALPGSIARQQTFLRPQCSLFQAFPAPNKTLPFFRFRKYQVDHYS
jgi:hypothetical protein